MKTSIVVFVLSSFILFKLSEAHLIRIGKAPPPSPGPMPRPKAPPPRPTSTSTLPPTAAPSPLSDRITPKCYPETAKAYFLPAPPSSPKVTVLDYNLKEEDLLASIKSSIKEMPSSSTLASNIISNRPSFAPPPTPVPVLPDLIDEIPTLVQDQFSRLAESDVKVCDACASMIGKLPIFKFDKELLDGFLVGLGI